MSQLGGVLSLFFIAAALVTSWYGEPQKQTSEVLLPPLQLADY